MKERGILFRGAMVLALLAEDAPKTQTRRAIKWPFDGQPRPEELDNLGDGESLYTRGWKVTCPYGFIGDRLWVRETAMLRSIGPAAGELSLTFAAEEGMDRIVRDYVVEKGKKNPYKATSWTPGIHMPRWASRIVLEVTDLNVERVQEITEADAAAEGIVEIERGLRTHGRMNGYGTPGTTAEEACTTRVNAYEKLWDKMRAGTEFSWKHNPYVWVVAFKRIG